MTSVRSLKEAPITKGTRVVLRADFDVAVEKGRVREDFRIKEVIPTIRFILKKGGRIRIISHLKRPGGKKVNSLSMRVVARRLEKLLGEKVVFVSSPFVLSRRLESCRILFFENVRFFRGEEENNYGFAKKLSRLGDIYVNEAFANSHRRHASMAAITSFLPSFAGLHLAKEILELEKVLKKPQKPLIAVLGGAKLETKLPLIERFLKMGGRVLLGGAMVNTIFAAKGIRLGRSPVDEELTRKLKRLAVNRRLYLPADLIVARGERSRSRVAGVNDLAKDEINLDIGPLTIRQFTRILKQGKTVIWNGPLGLAENRKFASGTISIAGIIQKIKACRIVGGGDTITILKKYGQLKGFSHVSTGGGAMLEFLAGKKLPGIEALKRGIVNRV